MKQLQKGKYYLNHIRGYNTVFVYIKKIDKERVFYTELEPGHYKAAWNNEDYDYRKFYEWFVQSTVKPIYPTFVGFKR